jgi:aldehyde dehydrogenase (NAD+)
VLVSLTFRTPTEAIELANNTPYGLAASVWSQDLDTALDVAKHLQAGTVWINSTNLFDAGAGFGGYKESGYGREGGPEGLRSYLKAMEGLEDDEAKTETAKPLLIDRSLKLYIGGKHVRPDSGNSYQCQGADVPLGNRKDVRHAVEAATTASRAWRQRSAPERSQILQFLAENLVQRSESMAAPSTEVVRAAEEAFRWAAWADKNDGDVHAVPGRYVTLAMKEPYGVIAAVAPGSGSLLSIVRASCSALALGNAVIWLSSEINPFAAFDLAQVMAISDVPPGCWNLLSGPTEPLAGELASHESVDAVWCFQEAVAEIVERESAGNLKPTWIASGKAQDAEYLAHSIRTKNIWIPYGC